MPLLGSLIGDGNDIKSYGKYEVQIPLIYRVASKSKRPCEMPQKVRTRLRCNNEVFPIVTLALQLAL